MGKKKRQVGAQFNVRLEADVKLRFQAAMDRLSPMVRQTGGAPLNQTAIVRYWAAWFSELGCDEQKRWARTYRDAEDARIARLEAEAESAAKSDPDLPAFRGHDTTGKAVPVDSLQPRDRGPAGRSKRK